MRDDGYRAEGAARARDAAQAWRQRFCKQQAHAGWNGLGILEDQSVYWLVESV